MHLVRSLVFAPLLIGSLSAQAYRDDFNSYPAGPIVPGWTQQRGTWVVTPAGRLAVTSGSLWAYLTKDGFAATRSVLDGEFFFVGTGVQFAGLTSRHPGGNVDSNLLMVKIQNNGAAADFDRVFSYERNVALGTFFVDIPGGTVNAYCRMVTLDNEFWIETDADRDGVFELVLARRPITLPLTGTGVGLNAFATSEVDNFEFFDAVLTPQPGAVPRVGANYDLLLSTPANTTPWLGLVALGNTGFPIGTRAIPVDPDFLAVATFGNAGFGLAGMTDANGNSAVSLLIPPIPGLVGIRLFASAITLDGTMPYAVGHISNEQAFVIQP